MGRQPGQGATNTDKDGFLSVGEKEILRALKSTLKAVEEGNIITDEYSFTFTTAEVCKRAGGLKRMSGRRQSYCAELSVEIFIEVKTAFEAVENGFLTEGGYYFELATPYFHFTSGHYPGKDESTRKVGAKESVPWSLGNYFPDLDSICKQIHSLIKKKLEVGLVRPPGSLKKIDGQRNVSQIRIAVRYILVACVLMAHADALPIGKEEKPVTLTAGTNGIVPFECSNEHQSASKYYTIRFEEKERPFYIDGILDPEGLMSPDQAGRFAVEYYEDGSAMSIQISITSVSVEDQGTYVVMVIVHGDAPEYHFMKRVVIIIVPPSPAECLMMRSESYKEYYLIHCHSKPGNGNSTLTCFQNNKKLRSLPYTVNANHAVQKRIFWLMNIDNRVFCCAHDVNEIKTVTQDSCNQYKYPQIEPFPSHVSPGHKAPSEIVHTTKPLPIEEENEKLPAEAISYSGCTPNFAWPTLLLPAITFMTYACISNP